MELSMEQRQEVAAKIKDLIMTEVAAWDGIGLCDWNGRVTIDKKNIGGLYWGPCSTGRKSLLNIQAK